MYYLRNKQKDTKTNLLSYKIRIRGSIEWEPPNQT